MAQLNIPQVPGIPFTAQGLKSAQKPPITPNTQLNIPQGASLGFGGAQPNVTNPLFASALGAKSQSPDTVSSAIGKMPTQSNQPQQSTTDTQNQLNELKKTALGLQQQVASQPQTGQQTQQQTPQQAPTPDRFSQLQALQEKAQTAGQLTPEEEQLRNQLASIQGSSELGLAKISNTPEPMALVTGQSAYLQKQAEAQMTPLIQRLATVQAQRAAALQGAQTAIGAEQTKLGYQQPVSVAPGQALISPVTGEQIGGNVTLSQLSGGGGAGGFIGSLADSVEKGMSYTDAIAQLPSSAMAPALFQELKKRDPNFSITAANARAEAARASTLQTGTTGGQLQKASVSANQALDTLQEQYNKLGSLSKSGLGVPILSQIAQAGAMALGPGRESVSAYQGALKEARAQISSVLAPIVGVDSAGQTSNSLLPDNMMPEEIPQKIQAAKDYIAQRVGAFTGSQGGTGGFQEGQTSNDKSLIFKGGKWQVNR